MPSAADLPGAATDPTDADGRIYVAGGAIGQAGLRRVDVYDPAQNLVELHRADAGGAHRRRRSLDLRQ